MQYTHYDYLELPPGASVTRIEAAYQALRQRFDGESDAAIIRLIHEAYAVLSDPDLRHGYDAALERAAVAADAELKASLDRQGTTFPRRVQEVPATLAAAVNAWAA